MVKFCRLLFGAGDIQESAHAYFAGDRTMEIQKGAAGAGTAMWRSTLRI